MKFLDTPIWCPHIFSSTGSSPRLIINSFTSGSSGNPAVIVSIHLL
jgi:hypothetical protein